MLECRKNVIGNQAMTNKSTKTMQKKSIIKQNLIRQPKPNYSVLCSVGRKGFQSANRG